MDTNQITVLIVDDHPVVRDGVRTMLAAEPDICVVGEAGTCEEAVRQASRLQPEIVLLDVRIPGDGIEAAKRLAGQDRCQVIMLTAHEGREFLQRAIEAGAAGYLLKDVAREEMARAIRAVHGGQNFISPALSHLIFDQLKGAEGAEGKVVLTDRQRDVLRMLSQGSSTIEIADRICVSEGTVRRDLYMSIRALGARGRADAIARAFKKGLI